MVPTQLQKNQKNQNGSQSNLSVKPLKCPDAERKILKKFEIMTN